MLCVSSTFYTKILERKWWGGRGRGSRGGGRSPKGVEGKGSRRVEGVIKVEEFTGESKGGRKKEMNGRFKGKRRLGRSHGMEVEDEEKG